MESQDNHTKETATTQGKDGASPPSGTAARPDGETVQTRCRAFASEVNTLLSEREEIRLQTLKQNIGPSYRVRWEHDCNDFFRLVVRLQRRDERPRKAS